MKSIKVFIAVVMASCVAMPTFASTSEEVNHDSHPTVHPIHESVDRPIDKIIIPEVARGHEEDYLKFLRCTLVYKPHGASDEERIEIPIGILADPLHGTFDISRCGNASQYLVISTGYRTEQKPEHAEKMEVWITPRFLVEANLNGNAAHLKPMRAECRGRYNEHDEVNIFWTWGTWDHESIQEDDENEWYYPTRGRDCYDYHTVGSSSECFYSELKTLGYGYHPFSYICPLDRTISTSKVNQRLSSSALFDNEASFSQFFHPYRRALWDFFIDTSPFCRILADTKLEKL